MIKVNFCDKPDWNVTLIYPAMHYRLAAAQQLLYLFNSPLEPFSIAVDRLVYLPDAMGYIATCI